MDSSDLAEAQWGCYGWSGCPLPKVPEALQNLFLVCDLTPRNTWWRCPSQCGGGDKRLTASAIFPNLCPRFFPWYPSPPCFPLSWEITQFTRGQNWHLTPASSPSLGPSCDFTLAGFSTGTHQGPHAPPPNPRPHGEAGRGPGGQSARMPLLFVSGQLGIPA